MNLPNRSGDNLLMVFMKNPEKGNVKTRLARTVGNDKALQVYYALLEMTLDMTRELSCGKAIFYSDFIAFDAWKKSGFTQYLQNGDSLGEKMENAFRSGFSEGYKKIIIIGSDCPDLNGALIEKAFDALDENDVVVGPAEDGGYYLLGMTSLHSPLFSNKKWSTAVVMAETMEDVSDLGLTCFRLPVLSDVDEEKDLLKFPRLLDLVRS